MSNQNVHTVHNSKSWTNRYENSKRTLGYYDINAKAKEAGRQKAIKNNLEHVNGKIQNKKSYGKDSYSLKDKK